MKMSSKLDWKNSEDTRDIVHIVVQALVEGRLVAMPAETAYHVVASGLKPAAVEELVAMAGRREVRPPCIFLRSPVEALDYSPNMSLVAARFVHRGWPGPLVLELPVERDKSLLNCLPSVAQDSLLLPGDFLPQRVASHEAVVQAMRLMPGPLIAASMIDEQGKAVCEGQHATALAREKVAAVVDDGATHFGDFASIVRVDGSECSLRAPGVVDMSNLNKLSQLLILLVCTGNTCRSPMAEVMFCDKLKRRFPSLFGGEYPPAAVLSAGLSAFPGGPAAPEAVSIMKKRGLDLQAHQSRSLTERLLRHADLVLTMTKSHRAAIVDRMPVLDSRVHLLSGTLDDVSDPFGGPESSYAACAEQIDQFLDVWLEQIDESWFPSWLPY